MRWYNKILIMIVFSLIWVIGMIAYVYFFSRIIGISDQIPSIILGIFYGISATYGMIKIYDKLKQNSVIG